MPVRRSPRRRRRSGSSRRRTSCRCRWRCPPAGSRRQRDRLREDPSCSSRRREDGEHTCQYQERASHRLTSPLLVSDLLSGYPIASVATQARPVRFRPSRDHVTVTEVRVDRWLWAARLFKTRSAATEAVLGGRVHVNGVRVKPAKGLRAGDRLEVTVAHARRELTVLALRRSRLAAVAATLYEESSPSRSASRELALERRQSRPLGADLARDRRARPAPARRASALAAAPWDVNVIRRSASSRPLWRFVVDGREAGNDLMGELPSPAGSSSPRAGAAGDPPGTGGSGTSAARPRRAPGRPRMRNDRIPARKGEPMDWKLELVSIPVTDVDRAKAFYVEQQGSSPTTTTSSATSFGSSQLRRQDRRARSRWGSGSRMRHPARRRCSSSSRTWRRPAPSLPVVVWTSARCRISRGARSSSSTTRTGTTGRCSSCRVDRTSARRSAPYFLSVVAPVVSSGCAG